MAAMPITRGSRSFPIPSARQHGATMLLSRPAMATKLNLKDGDVVRLKTETGQIELPVFIQPGQEPRTISVAMGYGRWQVGRAGQNVGVNAYHLVSAQSGHRLYSATNVQIEKTGRTEKLASTQTHFSMEGRPIVLETSLEELHKDAEAARNRGATHALGGTSPGRAFLGHGH